MLGRKIVRLLPAEFKNSVKQRLEQLNLALAAIFAHNRWSSSLYYLVVSSHFRREMHAVLQGRSRYRANLRQAVRSSPLLRRNIHRLEKGLIMQPRRPVFALDYIGETLDAYQQACVHQQVERAELQWAHDVLAEYFHVCGSHPVLDAARARFYALRETPSTIVEASSQPYEYRDLPAAAVSFEQLSVLFHRRRSVRWFLPTPVPTALLYQAVGISSQAPSACNRQPFRFDLLAHADDAQKIAALAMGTAGFDHNIPCLIVVVGDLSCYPAERDRHVIYIDASLATMQLMLALDTLGLASCPINWPDIESRERAIAQKLKLEPFERPVMLLAIGYPDPAGGIAFSQKKSADLLIREVNNVY